MRERERDRERESYRERTFSALTSSNEDTRTWLGARLEANQYVWEDGTPFDYSPFVSTTAAGVMTHRQTVSPYVLAVSDGVGS